MQKQFFRFVDDVGDGTGSRNMAVNGAGTPAFGFVTAFARPFLVWEVVQYLKGGPGAILAANLGLIAAPTRDTFFGLWSDAPALNKSYMAGTGYRRNRDLEMSLFDTQISEFASGDNWIVGRLQFGGSHGPVRVPLGWSFGLGVVANLLGLDEFYCKIRGEWEY